MNLSELAQQRQHIIDRYGEWTNHNLRLPDGSYTIGPELPKVITLPDGSQTQEKSNVEAKLQRFLQVISDLCGGDFSTLRILDLACLEGLYGLELAMQGAQVVGIEGRESNLAKARFTAEAWGLDNIEFFCDDVRNLSPETYGSFDVVLCLGIFYHLDAPDIFKFMADIHRVTRQMAIVDTHVSFKPERSYDYDGRTYWGRDYGEDHTAWGSIGNEKSVWLTRASLFELMLDVGFSSVYECHQPLVMKFEQLRHRGQIDRSTFIGRKGTPVTLKAIDTNPKRERFPELPHAEHSTPFQG